MVPADNAPREGLRNFVKRERVVIAGCCITFSLLMLYAIFSVDPAYNYPRLITDQLLYYLKALSFLHHGTLDARAAVNVPPFFYAAGPGLLRVPFIVMFSGYDEQLRAIQLSNIPIALSVGIMSAYIFSEVVPRRFHKAVIVFSFASELLNPMWVTNVLSLLTDLPFAAATLGTVILVRDIITGPPESRSSVWKKILAVILFIVALITRFTALGILPYAWVLYRRERKDLGLKRLTSARFIIPAALVLLVLAVNMRTLIYGYLWQPLLFLVIADESAMLWNTLTVSIPAQIVPTLELLYRVLPTNSPRHPQFASNPFDLALLIVGIMITAVVATGTVVSARKRAAELWLVLLPLPVFAIVLTSTTRYLFTYQPFYWIFATIGAVAIVKRIAPNFRLTRRIVLGGAALTCVAAASLVAIRSIRVTNEGLSLRSFSLGETRRHAGEVADTYRKLRGFLEQLPRGKSLVINERQRTGQWTVIAHVDHYQVDGAIEEAARKSDIYLIVDCATPADCSRFDKLVALEQKRILEHGKFRFDTVFESANRWSHARVYKLTLDG